MKQRPCNRWCGRKAFQLGVAGFVVWGLLAVGCATPRPDGDAVAWRCDTAADTAVARGDWQAALEGHLALLRQSPDNCLALYHLGYIRGHLGDRALETAAYEQAVACGYDQDDRLFFNLGMAYGALGDLERAGRAMERAVALDPENGDNHFGLALVAASAGHSEKAEQALRRAITVAPTHLEARLELVQLILDQGRWGEARTHLAAVRAMDPGNGEARRLQQILESLQAGQYSR
ncbi:tetratricopeptide repeat protein [Desulfatitalea alkaliphila]|uniref:Tetratricopeptide repeat protein n=1 Tax=Desulfatitalea alkaliphila TaxID=2929485 RepID=A0AA41R685_9BACT|nr:tetratricopeptide repeat protein [Desulfatitalea alkaliphila]MCJ8501671.1 tetratricopeptide repeat protein [Desulfatitalea alkaliphila]